MPKMSVQEYLDVPASWKVRENVKQEIVLMPTKTDIRTAKKGDPQACALHNAACRMYDIPNCAIGGRWAYIPQRDANGKHYIARMQATSETQRAIKKFDKTGEMPEGGFRFIPIAKSHTYKVKRAYMKAWTAGEVGSKDKPRKFTKRIRKAPMRSIPTNVAP